MAALQSVSAARVVSGASTIARISPIEQTDGDVLVIPVNTDMIGLLYV
jgi:hypothetical protein